MKKTNKKNNIQTPLQDREIKRLGVKTTSVISNTIIYAILIIITIVWLIPFVCIFLESLRLESTQSVGYIIPKQWGFDNYVRLIKDTDFPKWFMNTLTIGIVVAIIQTMMVLLMSYTLSRLRFKGRKTLMNFMLVLGMFPGFITMILLFRLLGWYDMVGADATIGLIIVYTASSGMGYYISKGFFDTISKSLDEAARIDGATRFQVFTKIIMPLSKPIIIYTILTAFMAPWGDFMFASYIANNSSDGFTVAVGLQSWMASKSLSFTNYTMFCAGGVLTAIPITILFMCLQKYYVEGVTGGAVKG